MKNRHRPPLISRLLVGAAVNFAPGQTFAQTMIEATHLAQKASRLQECGRLNEAEPLLRQSLAIIEQLLGPRHAYIAMRLSDLAEVSEAQGHPAEAEVFYRRALEIRQRIFSPNHPELLKNQKALAHLQADYKNSDARLPKQGLLSGAQPILVETQFVPRTMACGSCSN